MKRVFQIIVICLACSMCTPSHGSTDTPGGDVTPALDTTATSDSFSLVPDVDLSSGWGTDQPEDSKVYFNNPVYSDYTSADPTWIRVGEYFYSYSTGDFIHILRSKDMVHWEFIGKAFTKWPSWLKRVDGSNPGLWAPDINYIGGRYVLYYSLNSNRRKADDSGNERFDGIGVATADSPEGPFTDHGKLIADEDFEVNGSLNKYTIDPVFYEEDGHKYIIWGSFRRIFLTELTDDGLAVKYPGDGTKVTVIGCAQWEGSVIHKRGNYYYYIGSNGNPLKGENSDYRAQVARSTSLLGPYVSKDGKQLLKSDTMTPLLYGNASFIAPGHTSKILTDDAGNDWIAYHGYVKGKANALGRILFIDRIDWTEDGWPVINSGNGPTTSAEAPALD
ncbi:MAG: family 43 glycosylhydrolase [Bacteroidales bacterium]|nr:family 43 glycosylhydrolase [Bacteroidales bacterium]